MTNSEFYEIKKKLESESHVKINDIKQQYLKDISNLVNEYFNQNRKYDVGQTVYDKRSDELVVVNECYLYKPNESSHVYYPDIPQIMYIVGHEDGKVSKCMQEQLFNYQSK